MNGNEILKLGIPPGPAVGEALTVARSRGADRWADTAAELTRVGRDPHAYLNDPEFGPVARHLITDHAVSADELRDPVPLTEFGGHLIDDAARAQMHVAARLPVSVRGALMPDAHVGYGLPIGGVLATDGAVIPYGVGVDIGCAMQLSVLPVRRLPHADEVKLLQTHTRFGAGVSWEPRERPEHEVLDEGTWDALPLLRHLHGKAAAQLGTSGSGNHFVEFGTLTLDGPDLGLEAGEYVALLSHSGSRGFGAQVAGHFTKLAEKLHPNLPPEARKLAWLDLNGEDGQAYWTAMELAGRYALANHHAIHERITRALRVKPLVSVSNSHNLAWKQVVDGRELIVHRKGATPAAAGQLGFIPGSMADPGFVVRGRGHADALASASHGAGRQLGRRAAERTLVRKDVQRVLKERGVTLIGGGVDEAPQAYKRIEDVIAAQGDLIEVVARFTPRVVRMDTGSEDI